MARWKQLLAATMTAAALTGTAPAITFAQETAPVATDLTTPQPSDATAPAAGVTPAPDAAADAAPAAVHHAPIPFFSLFNTNFVVLIAFLVFVAVLLYLKVPATLGGMLDRRAEAIRKELADARKMREDAQTLLASYERKQQEVKAQAERIVASARAEAADAAEKAHADLARAIERRLKAAEEQIESARAAAIRDVRNHAAEIAVQAAGEILAGQMTAERADALVDDAITEVRTRLN